MSRLPLFHPCDPGPAIAAIVLWCLLAYVLVALALCEATR
jgi:hypothetical protein